MEPCGFTDGQTWGVCPHFLHKVLFLKCLVHFSIQDSTASIVYPDFIYNGFSFLVYNGAVLVCELSDYLLSFFKEREKGPACIHEEVPRAPQKGGLSYDKTVH